MNEVRVALRDGFDGMDPCPGVESIVYRKPYHESHGPCTLLMKTCVKPRLKLVIAQNVTAISIRLLASLGWKRCWICYEFIVARDVEFVEGGVSINCEDLAVVLFHLRYSGSDWAWLTSREAGSLNNLHSLLAKAIQLFAGEAMDLKVWLQLWREMQILGSS